MKLRIYKTNGKYAFSIDGFSSLHHANLIPDIQPSYTYAWQAYRKAKDLALNRTSHVEAVRNKKYAIEDLAKPVRVDEKAESLLFSHYATIVDDLEQKVIGIDDNPEDEKEITYQTVKSIVSDLLRVIDALEDDKYKSKFTELINRCRKIVQHHFKSYLDKDKEEQEEVEEEVERQNAEMAQESEMPTGEGGIIENIPPDKIAMRMAKKKILSEEELEELMNHYADRICSAISKHHPDALPKCNTDDLTIDIICAEMESKPILRVCMNDNFNINNILSSGILSQSFPTYSSRFYQRYWKPIVESVDHIYIEEIDAFIFPKMAALPDMSEEDSKKEIKGWNPKELKEIPLCMSFGDKSMSWTISKSSTVIKQAQNDQKYVEEDFLRTQPTRVRCIDESLNIYGKYGEVVQVIPINSGIGFQVDVDFGRKVIRLSQDQIEIVDDI